MRVLKVIISAIVGLVIGLAIGLGISKIGEMGIGESWKQLSMPPEAVSELIPFGDPPVFIKT